MATKTGPLAATHLRYNTLEEGVEFLQLFDEAYSVIISSLLLKINYYFLKPTESKERDMLGRRISVHSPAKLGMTRRMSVAAPKRSPVITLQSGLINP